MRNEIEPHLAWYEAELARLGVDVRRGRAMGADAVRAFRADKVVIATGARPPLTGYQRGLPEVDSLPGVELGNVCSINDVLSGRIAAGRRVLLIDDLGGSWAGPGTALKLAQEGHAVTIVTRDAYVAMEAARGSTDKAIRKGLAKAGADMRPMSAVMRWMGDGATIRHLPTGAEESKPFDTLVLAETPRSDDALFRALADTPDVHAAGDCIAFHFASGAIYDGRRVAMSL